MYMYVYEKSAIMVNLFLNMIMIKMQLLDKWQMTNDTLHTIYKYFKYLYLGYT